MNNLIPMLETAELINHLWYEVPTVRGMIYGKLRNWPVYGPRHSDVEIIGFPYEHFHIDWRFVATRDYESLSANNYVNLAAIVLHRSENDIASGGLPAPVMRKLKCKRSQHEYPIHKAKRHWLTKLEDKYKDCRIKTLVCPHQGLPLDSLPCKHGEVVTCPGHGLSWNIKSGLLVRY